MKGNSLDIDAIEARVEPLEKSGFAENQDVLALVREVRRLRAFLKSAVEFLPVCYGEGEECCGSDGCSVGHEVRAILREAEDRK